MGFHGLRDLYNTFERLATPVANDLTRSDEFALVTGLWLKLNKGVRGEVNKATAKAWHLVNLPAGTDVQRLKNQVASLDREVRLLTLELERSRKEVAKRRGVDSRTQRD